MAKIFNKPRLIYSILFTVLMILIVSIYWLPNIAQAITPTPSPNSGTPYAGSPYAIPGKIEAENFNKGGEGIAYHDADAANQGGQYRTSEGVDIQTTSDTGGGYNVGWTATGEWLKYTVNVQTAGLYNLDFRVASAHTGSTFHLEVDGINVSSVLTVPNTGGWQTWTDVTKLSVSLSSGQHVLRLYVDAGGMNFNWFSLNLSTTQCTPIVLNVSPVVSPTTNMTQTINMSASGGGLYQFTVSQSDAQGTQTYPSTPSGSSTAITINLVMGNNALTVSVNGEVGCTGPNGPFTTFVTTQTTVATNGSPLSILQTDVTPSPTSSWTPTFIPSPPTQSFNPVTIQGYVYIRGSGPSCSNPPPAVGAEIDAALTGGTPTSIATTDSNGFYSYSPSMGWGPTTIVVTVKYLNDFSNPPSYTFVHGQQADTFDANFAVNSSPYPPTITPGGPSLTPSATGTMCPPPPTLATSTNTPTDPGPNTYTPTASNTPTATPTCGCLFPTKTYTPTVTNTVGVAPWDGNFHPYSIGDLVSYMGHIYKCIQAHTSQPGWDPVSVPALWVLVS